MTVLLRSVLTVSCYNNHFLISIFTPCKPPIKRHGQTAFLISILASPNSKSAKHFTPLSFLYGFSLPFSLYENLYVEVCLLVNSNVVSYHSVFSRMTVCLSVCPLLSIIFHYCQTFFCLIVTASFQDISFPLLSLSDFIHSFIPPISTAPLQVLY